MDVVQVDTLIVGAGQAGVAMSAHLQTRGIDHVALLCAAESNKTTG